MGDKITHPVGGTSEPFFLQNKVGYSAHNENGGYGNISSINFHGRGTRRLHSFTLPFVEKTGLQIRTFVRGGVSSYHPR